MDKRWYVLRTYSGHEAKVKTYLETEIARIGLQEKISNVLIPSEKVFEIKDGKKKSRLKNFFPGYILVEAVLDKESTHLILEAPSVMGFVPDKTIRRHCSRIIFCDDQSTDGTAAEVRRMQKQYPERNIRLIQGPGICKSKNVWCGFEAATGDILLILDADLTVMPEELPYFIHAITRGSAEFVNGSRLIYPVPKAAMKTANLYGNKFFSAVFSYLLGQRIKDTLCGTKVLWRTDWDRIRPLVGTWGTLDRWGDYELLFGAAKLNLRILDQPVHYQERIFGATKMTKVFKNGLTMLRMCGHGFRKLKVDY